VCEVFDFERDPFDMDLERDDLACILASLDLPPLMLLLRVELFTTDGLLLLGRLSGGRAALAPLRRAFCLCSAA